MKPHERLEMEIAMEQIAKIVPAMMGAYPCIAKMMKAYFDELVKEGFTEVQALHIVTIQGVTARLGS